MSKVLNWIAACLICLSAFSLKAQEMHEFRDHILYYGAPKGNIKNIRLQLFEGSMLYTDESAYITVHYSTNGQLERIIELNLEDQYPVEFSFRHLNEEEISWEKTQLGQLVLSGKIVLEKEGEQLKKISNYEKDRLVEVTEYHFEDGGRTKEVIQMYNSGAFKMVRTYQDGRLISSEQYSDTDDQLLSAQRYNYVGDMAKIELYDAAGKRLVGSDMRTIRRDNDRGDWTKLERQFSLPYGQRYQLHRKIEYADEEESIFPASFKPGNWYSFLFKPNLLFFECNEDGTYDLGFQSMILDHGTYQLNGNELLLQSSQHGRKGTFECKIEDQLLSIIPKDDPDQFFSPFMMRMEGEEGGEGKLDPELYNEFLRIYMRLIYGD